jgi:hypothetical protein
MKRTIRFFVCVSLIALAACVPAPSKPSIVINAPPSGSQFREGEDVAIQSIATDQQGVTRVELFVDGALARMDPSPSPQTQFSILQTWKAAAGTHTITVRAYDTEGTASDPAAISVTIVPSVAQAATPTIPATPPAPPAVSPTSAPGGAPSTPAPTGCTDNSAFVSDVTISDGTNVSPNQSFTKTWRVSNNGTCTWGSGYQLVFVSGNAMTASTVVAVPNTPPGATADLSVPMTAPASAGNVTGQWRLRNAAGSFFGATLTVKIVVVSAAPPATTAAPPGGLTLLPLPTGLFIPTRTPTPTPTLILVLPLVPLVPLVPILPTTSEVGTQVSVPAGNAGSATATCPSGTVLTGGGFASQISAQTKVYTQSKEGNGWEVYLYNGSGSSQLVNAYAICLANTSGATTQALKQVSVPAGSTGSATATCPAGSIVTGGGYASQTSLSTEVYTQSKSGNGWEVYLNNTTGSSQLVNAYAICLSGTSGSSTQILKQVSVSAGSTGSATAICSSGSILTGGGYASQPTLQTKVYTQSKADNGWEVFMNNSSGASQLLNSYAICVSF